MRSLNLSTQHLTTLMLAVLITACSGPAIMGTDIKSEKKTSQKRPNPPHASQNQGANAAATKEHGVAQSSSGQGINQQDSSYYDENLRVMPPEVVSGAYLTCNFIPPQQQEVGSTYYGCGLVNEHGDQLDLRGLRKDYELTDLSGKPLKADVKEIQLNRYDRVWRIALENILLGIRATLVLTDKNNQLLRIEGAPRAQDSYPEFLFKLLADYFGKAWSTMEKTFQLNEHDVPQVKDEDENG